MKEDYILHAGLHLSLTYLNLSRNRLDILPDALIQLQSLKKLKISFNFISALPTGCNNWANLSKLKVYICVCVFVCVLCVLVCVKPNVHINLIDEL